MKRILMLLAGAGLGVALARRAPKQKEGAVLPVEIPDTLWRIEVWRTNRIGHRWHEEYQRWLPVDLPDGWSPAPVMLLYGKGDGRGGSNRLRNNGAYARSQQLIIPGTMFISTQSERDGLELRDLIRAELPERVRLVRSDVWLTEVD